MFCSQPLVHAKETWSEAFHTQIQQWINDIAMQDSAFAQWKSSTSKVETLGANQHQWLVSLSSANQPVGYLVVAERHEENSQAPSFVLLEYGLGMYPLFNEAFSPKDESAKPVYNGLASYWQVSDANDVRLVDAKTGEIYPSTVKPDTYLFDTLPTDDFVAKEKHLTKTRSFSRTETDPYDKINWLLSAGQPISLGQLLEEKGDHDIVLKTTLFQNQVLAPYTLGSVHIWNDSAAYVGVWNEGLRFVPYAYVSKVGQLLVQ